MPNAHSPDRQQVLDYLGRHTHRVAIGNSRLLGCENGRVRFRWKDYRANNKCKVMTLHADEFIRRFLLHTLPKGFRRIRHFGFLANACRASKLARIRTALNVPKPAATVEPADYRERYAILTGHRIDLCPVCAGRMVEIGRWPRSASPEDIRAKALRATRPTASREPLRGFHQGFAPQP